MVPKNLQSSNGETGIENRLKDPGRGTWKLTLPYVKYIANGNLLCDSGNSNWGSVTT